MELSESVFWDCIQYLGGLAAKALEGQTCYVSVGGSEVQRQDEFLVREMPESVTFSDRVTSAMGQGGARGCYRVEFNVPFDAWARRPSLARASSLVLAWCQSVFAAVAADKTLGGLAVHAEPYFESGGTAHDKSYLAGVSCGVHIKAEIDPAAEAKE